MDNQAQQTQIPVQPPAQNSQVPPVSKTPTAFILGALGVLVIVGIFYAGIEYEKIQLSKNKQSTIYPPATPTPTVASRANVTPTIAVSPMVTSTPTPTTPPATPTPTSLPVQRTFEEEELLMRKTLAGIEMYIANSNTAGALTFFTPAISKEAKEKYEYIRTKNLPFALKSWSFVEKTDYKLATEEINGGYRVRMYECRTNLDTCPILFFELVRSEKAENKFLVERYYNTQYASQNNLGEEIKYQGFGL